MSTKIVLEVKNIKSFLDFRKTDVITIADNTTVRIDRSTNKLTVKYHDTDIAEMNDKYIFVTNGGFHTRSTKERINKILHDNDVYFYTRIFKGVHTLEDYNGYVTMPNIHTVLFIKEQNHWELNWVKFDD